MVGKYLKFVIAFAVVSAIGVQLHSNTTARINAITINTGENVLLDKPYQIALLSHGEATITRVALTGLSII
jgi:hypothetical protein